MQPLIIAPANPLRMEGVATAPRESGRGAPFWKTCFVVRAQGNNAAEPCSREGCLSRSLRVFSAELVRACPGVNALHLRYLPSNGRHPNRRRGGHRPLESIGYEIYMPSTHTCTAASEIGQRLSPHRSLHFSLIPMALCALCPWSQKHTELSPSVDGAHGGLF